MTTTELKALIQSTVGNYPVTAFQNLGLQRILLLLADMIGSGGSGGGSGTPAVVRMTSANFTTATDCPISSLDGLNIAVYWNEANKFLEKDAAGGAEWADLTGGGFRVLLSGFASTADNYHFYVFVL